MAKHTTSRSHVLREVAGLAANVRSLQETLSGSASERVQCGQPTIESAPLHKHIRSMEDHLVQLKTLTNYRSTP